MRSVDFVFACASGQAEFSFVFVCSQWAGWGGGRRRLCCPCRAAVSFCCRLLLLLMCGLFCTCMVGSLGWLGMQIFGPSGFVIVVRLPGVTLYPVSSSLSFPLGCRCPVRVSVSVPSLSLLFYVFLLVCLSGCSSCGLLFWSLLSLFFLFLSAPCCALLNSPLGPWRTKY